CHPLLHFAATLAPEYSSLPYTTLFRSGGNAYLIQHMVAMLGKMYSFHIINNTEPSTICETAGILLIDEAENHLHPRWQKRFISTDRKSTRLNSSHVKISYAVFCLTKKS